MGQSAPTELAVGWIGTGRMGAPLAERLARAGVDVTAWNRTRAKAEALTPAGIKVAAEPRDVAGLDVVFTMVAGSQDLVAVTEQLLAGHSRAPRYLVDCSTVSAEASARVRAMAAGRGTAFLAAPVSGNGRVARAGLLTVVVSGPREAFDALEPLLALLGRHVSYVGDGELSRLAKICHNLLLGVMAQSLAEITVLAEKGGMPRAAFLDFINNSVLGSAFTRYKSPALVGLDFTPTFTPLLLRKDLDLGLAAATELGVPMPVVAAAREPVQAAIAQGRTDEDFAVLIELAAAAAGYRITAEDTQVDDGLGLSAGQPAGQPANQPAGQPANQPASQTASQSANQPAGQPANQPAGQPANQPAGQPARRPDGTGGDPPPDGPGTAAGQPATHSPPRLREDN